MAKTETKKGISKFWSYDYTQILDNLNTSQDGLTQEQAELRLEEYGPNLLKQKNESGNIKLFISQFKSPIIIILIIAAIISFGLHDRMDGYIIFTIILFSGVLGFWQERGAANAVEKLLEVVETKVEVIRDQKETEIPLDEVVPGDIVDLSAGRGIPGDCLIIDSKDLFINEATLTGETFPVEKESETVSANAALSQRTNSLFMGTHVVSGTAKAVVINTGRSTEFGKISGRLRLKPPETEFERGIRKFGYLLMEVTLILVIAIFGLNVYFHKPVLDSLLFSLALAVGLTPQLLPAIISVNLSYGAKRMAAKKVIVKRLTSIENFGCMNVLCSDKTGTLTDGTVKIHGAFALNGKKDKRVLFYSYLNAFFESGFISPIDKAIRSFGKFDVSQYKKIDEVPYDFIRKRLSVLIKKDDKAFIVTKGAVRNMVDICTTAELHDGKKVPIGEVKDMIKTCFKEFGSHGFRTLGVAYKNMSPDDTISKSSEEEMTLIGFITFWDPPKEGIVETIEELKKLGVSLKVITGDNELVAESIGKKIGINHPNILTGPELDLISEDALVERVEDIDIFAEVEPNEKERIIRALKNAGHVVGYIGDGINDASAIRAADVGISVDSAVDVAKESADIVLLEKDLSVLKEGVIEGRKTFANTLKYVFMATSANFGNMFSMAGASVFMKFLPLLPSQILLTNLLTDMPEMTIATDNVDKHGIEKPRRWDIKFIRNFMFTFGLLSSVFDFLTFGVLLYFLNASPKEFRTGWFVESIVSATMIVLVIRTRKSFLKSKPSKPLIWATFFIILLTHYIPYSPISHLLGFKPLPFVFLLTMWAIIILYVFSAEITKAIFYKIVKY